MIWDWLKKYNVSHLISDIILKKPRAIYFIADKGYRFENWKDTIQFVEKLR